jgi:uncharacterized protein YkwD
MINPNPKNKFIFQIVITVVSLTAMGFSTVSILNTLKEDGISESLKDRFRDVLSAQSFNQSYLPGPLSNINPETELISDLTQQEIIDSTNEKRIAAGLPKLTENSKLNASAEKKVDDMFALQYFEHDSPNGKDVGDLTKEAGYEYVYVGENLALGNFENSESMVVAWMNSPGHRANIENARFMEIGVSVKKGIYNGMEVWIGVQHFGEPLSACGTIDSDLKSQIDNQNEEIADLTNDLDALKEEIEGTAKSDPEYNQKVDEYNLMISDYNALSEDLKNNIDDYNVQVESFNDCINNH